MTPAAIHADGLLPDGLPSDGVPAVALPAEGLHQECLPAEGLRADGLPPQAAPLRLVLTGCGGAAALQACFAAAAPQLARLLQLPLRPLPASEASAAAPLLAALHAGLAPSAAPSSGLPGSPPFAAPSPPASSTPEATGWLAALPLDPGLPLADGGSWVEALAAWRQPTLLLMPAEALASGIPAAAVALQRQWGVPLLGMLQWGGPWCATARRRDGLPWLGWLPAQAASVVPEEAASEAASEAALEDPHRLDGSLRSLLLQRRRWLDLD